MENKEIKKSDKDFEITPEEMKAMIEEVFKPIPLSGIKKEDLDSSYENAKLNLATLTTTVLEGLKPPAGAYAFFHHGAHCLGRLEDCKKILERLYKGRILLTELHRKEQQIIPKDWPAGVPYPPEVQEIMQLDTETSSYMQIDLESLYMFGGILLDQWSLIAIAIANLPLKKQHPFVELVKFFEKEQNNILSPVWKELGREMLWLHFHLRFYRNRFIVHANRPWQRGTTMSAYGGDYNLFTPTPPGWDDDDSLDAEIRSLLYLAPKRIQEAKEDYWERARPGALIERIFENIPNLPRKADREKVANLFARKGGSTPSFQTLAKNLFNFIEKGTFLLNKIASENLSTINLGKPFATSQEMWEKYRSKKEEKD